MIAGAIDRNLNTTIFVSTTAQRFETAWRMDVFESKSKWQRKQLTKLGGNKGLQSRGLEPLWFYLDLQVLSSSSIF